MSETEKISPKKTEITLIMAWIGAFIVLSSFWLVHFEIFSFKYVILPLTSIGATLVGVRYIVKAKDLQKLDEARHKILWGNSRK